MTKRLYVEIEREYRQIRTAKPNYGGGGLSESEHDIGSVYFTDSIGYSNDYDTIPVPEHLMVGDVVFLLCAQWDENDSFNLNHGYGFEVIHVYTDAKAAFADQRILEYDDDPIPSFTEGRVYPRPWVGYFERLSWIEVKTRVIENAPD